MRTSGAVRYCLARSHLRMACHMDRAELWHEGEYGPLLSAVPGSETGGAANRLGSYIPGGMERRPGATTVRLDPTEGDAQGSRAEPPVDRGPRRVALAGRPACAVRAADAAQSRRRVRQLVEPAAPGRTAEVQEAWHPPVS